MVAADLLDADRLGLDLGAGPVQLDQEHGAGPLRIPGVDALLDGADHHLVQHLEGGRDDPVGDDGRHGLGGVLDRGERGEQRLDVLRQVQEAHQDRRHETEGPLRAHHDAGQVVAGPVLGLAAHPHQLPRARHHLEAQDMVHRDAVLQAMRSARVGRDVAADGGDHLARGVGGEEVAALPRRVAEPQIDEAGLHRRAAVRDVHLEDAVHPRHGDHDATLGSHGAADEPRARAAGDDGHVGPATEADHGRRLLGGFGEHDDVRDPLVEGVHVALVGEPALEGGDHPRPSHDPLQRRDQPRLHAHPTHALLRTA